VASFSLFSEDFRGGSQQQLKLSISSYDDPSLPGYITPTLNPNRPATILSLDIFELICSQMKYIANAPHKILIETTLKAMTTASLTAEENLSTPDAGDILWGTDAADSHGHSVEIEEKEKSRGRSLSPATRKDQATSRKLAANVGSSKKFGIEDGDTSDRKSRSSSQGRTSRIGTSIARDSSAALSGGQASNRQTDSPKTIGDADSIGSNPETMESQNFQNSILRSMPLDVAMQAAVCRGCFMGVRLWQHPLAASPAYVSDIRQSIFDSGLSDAKKFEWEMDLLRELDEKKMERYEAYLCSCRNVTSDAQLVSNSKYLLSKQVNKKKWLSEEGSNSKIGVPLGSYYKDKGKFPTRGSL
jgi:hypothetical protein